jgi:hypothetical protein
VKDVTIDQVNASAKKYLKPTTAIVLVVGDGDSPQIHRDDAGKDVPWVGEDSKPVTLRDSLTELVKTGTIGKGDFVELDADGNVVKK